MKMQQSRDEIQWLSTSDENVLINEVQATHAPSGNEFTVKTLFYITEDMFRRAALSIAGFVQGTKAQQDVLDNHRDFQQREFFYGLQSLLPIISKVSSEIYSNRSRGGDAHGLTVEIFKILESYAWDAKVVIALAAFALSYGEFWLVMQVYHSNPIAKSLAVLKLYLPVIQKHVEILKPKFEALNNLIEAMLDLTKSILEFKNPPPPEMPTTTAVYWIIRGIVVGSAQNFSSFGTGHEYLKSVTEAGKLNNLAHKINRIKQQLRPYQPNPDAYIFSTSEDDAIMKKVWDTHAPDGRKFAVKPLLDIIKGIFLRAVTSVPGFVQGMQAQLDAFDDENFQPDFCDMLDLFTHDINKVSYKISSPRAGGINVNETTFEIFNILTSYAWDAKAVIALAAFALNNGEFPVETKLGPDNTLATSMAQHEHSPEIPDSVNILQEKFKDFRSLILAMLQLTKCIVEFEELPSKHINSIPEMVGGTNRVITAVYWIIRSIVVCLAKILHLTVEEHENITELSLANTINSIYDRLTKQVAVCHQQIDNKNEREKYLGLQQLMESPNTYKMKVLRAFICAEDDQLPLLEGSTMRSVSFDVLKRKNVLLLISELDVSNEELFVLKQMYQKSRQHPQKTESQYEVVWLPLVDRLTQKFEFLQKAMPWYSVYHPSMIDSAVIRYIKEVWNFKKKPILVVLDIQGKVVNENAFHIIHVWECRAFPFSSTREEALWKDESWGIESLAGHIHEQQYICLYGGEDIQWIRKFITVAQIVAKDAEVPWEMLYMGKSNPGEKVVRNIVTINKDSRRDTLRELRLVWSFWLRLQSMWHFKTKFGRAIKNDHIMQAVEFIFSLDHNHKGWAVICKGSDSQMVKAEDESIFECFQQYQFWKPHLDKEEKDFVGAINNYLQYDKKKVMRIKQNSSN